jgi:hypothetical protein
MKTLKLEQYQPRIRVAAEYKHLVQNLKLEAVCMLAVVVVVGHKQCQ